MSYAVFIILYLCTFFLFFIISKRMFKTIYNYCNLYNAVWLIFGSLSMLGLFGFYKPDFLTSVFILIADVVFNIVGLAIENTVHYEKKRLDYTGFRINTSFLHFCNGVALIYIIPHTVKAIGVISTSGWTELRYLILHNQFIFTKIEMIIATWFVYPIYTATIVVLAINIASLKVRPAILVWGVVDILLSIFTNGSRGILFIFLIVTVAAFLLKEQRRKIYIPFKYKVLVGAGIATLIFVTMNRRIGDKTVLENIYAYFIGPFSFLDIIISKPREFGIFESPTFGIATFGWIFSTLQMFLQFVLKLDVEPICNVLSYYSGQYYQVSNTVKLNHTSTMLYPMLYDFGYLGVIIGPAIFAWIAFSIFKMARRNGRNRSLWIAYAIYFIQIIFSSSYEYMLIWGKTFFEFFYIFLFCYSFKKMRRRT